MKLESICFKVCELTEQVGGYIKQELTKVRSQHVEVKGKNDFVTYVDKGAEQLLVAGLGKLIPKAGFIAEENTSSAKGETYNWVIDPLDGTTNFIHGLPCYSISIGLLRDNTPVMGVVHELNLSECFYAWGNSKAYCNKTEIKVTQAALLKDTLVATGFPYYNYDRLDEYMEFFKHLMRETHGLRRLGSAAVDLAYVACGRFDAFYEYGLRPWDVAGGAFIVQQAGGKITDFGGGDNYIFGRELIACTPGIHNEFINSLQQYFKK
ncbi:MAG: inositol monophosphatase [Bacteroidetes bacterium]|nr:inositol monophosphatase [Bacteroidota bacterium]